ncbi:MAG: hypothetical protein IPL71_14215 [Anaerolineales bacterium]|uniref:hypothetical protein n=1 Tax=Candidatus Villigracilis proximus TaxID=3140683 RepID=UPI0031347CE3|nr:hypothetical protein [Anaerolineales bacterium]
MKIVGIVVMVLKMMIKDGGLQTRWHLLASAVINSFEKININTKIKFDFVLLLPLELPSSSPLVKIKVDVPIKIDPRWADIKIGGRTIGDGLLGPAFFTIGYLITIAPSQVENVAGGASFRESFADFVVDTGGFITSEWAGKTAGVLTTPETTVIGGITTNFTVDVLTGMAWDRAMDENGGRQKVVDFLMLLLQIYGDVGLCFRQVATRRARRTRI